MDQRRATPIFRYRYLIRIVLIVFWIALFTSTHVPLPEKLIPPGLSDKSLHLVTYLILAYLLAFATSTKRPLGLKLYLLLVVVIAAYGAIDELLQIPVNRHADVFDWVADILGGTVGFVLFALTQKMVPFLWKPRPV